MSIQASELILNPDGSIYHLSLLPQDLAKTVITVGDPERVPKISEHFSKIEVKKHKREFNIHTGFYKGERITVMSTGMGTDNIDIAFTELDALVNIDFEKREAKENLESLNIIRIGTTGSIQEDIPVDALLVSELSMGFDGLMHFYKAEEFLHNDISEEFVKQTGWSPRKAYPYVVDGDKELFNRMHSADTLAGFTATNIGFYGPQGRVLRLDIPDTEMNSKIGHFQYKDKRITNLEMETSGIYGMSKLLGHKAISMNAVLANRPKGEFTKDPSKLTADLIAYTLDRIVS